MQDLIFFYLPIIVTLELIQSSRVRPTVNSHHHLRITTCDCFNQRRSFCSSHISSNYRPRGCLVRKLCFITLKMVLSFPLYFLVEVSLATLSIFYLSQVFFILPLPQPQSTFSRIIQWREVLGFLMVMEPPLHPTKSPSRTLIREKEATLTCAPPPIQLSHSYKESTNIWETSGKDGVAP